MSIRNALMPIVFALSAVGVAADAGAQAKKGDGPCAADYQKFCAGVQPGEGRIARCMAGHKAELSPACQSAIKAGVERVDRFVKACKPDAEKYCKSIPVGDGRILSCLKGRESDLNPACAAEFKRARAER